MTLFENVPAIRNQLETLSRGDLLHQARQSSHASGVSPADQDHPELSKRATGKTIYLLDAPTNRLHFHDVKNLIAVLDDLVARGNTVVVIEHNLDLISQPTTSSISNPEGGMLRRRRCGRDPGSRGGTWQGEHILGRSATKILKRPNDRYTGACQSEPGCYLFSDDAAVSYTSERKKPQKARIELLLPATISHQTGPGCSSGAIAGLDSSSPIPRSKRSYSKIP